MNPAPIAATTIQCPFCAFVNVAPSDDALCHNCGLDLARLIAQKNGTATPPLPRPQIQESPSPLPVERFRKKKRSKRHDADPGAGSLEWLNRPVAPTPVAPAQVAPVAGSLAERIPTPAAFGFPTSPVDDIEATRVAQVATPSCPWLLQFEDGTAVALPGDDVVVGRQPEATETGVATLVIPDPLKELSRTHARLRRDTSRDTWTIEDMGSVNGVATVDGAGDATALSPRDAVAATEYLLLGTLRARLVRATPGHRS